MVTFAVVTVFLLGLVAVSIRLSHPIPLGLTIFTLLLPFTVFGAHMLRRLYSNRGGIGNLMQHPLVYAILQVLQGLVSVVLATLWFEGMVGSGPAVDCNLQSTWRGLWMAHDGRSIEGIQNAFGCCGYNSVRDMAWPSPGG
ncbi:hypothetical protein PG985_009235 [Apiospora marii]|uniref:uncharacterized protein n=1 Tax=Apiospora marii TaxID=335849 RepID=UPI00312F1079